MGKLRNTDSTYPMISVIIPSHQHERYLPALFSSLEREDYPNFEVIIIDDGSSDNSVDMIKAWTERMRDRLKIKWSARPNRGVTATLNDLVELATGEYVTAIHSDDYLLAGGLMARVKYLQEHPEKQAVFADCLAIDENGHELADSAIRSIHGGRPERFVTDRGLRREVINRWAVPGGTLMVRSEFYQNFRYDERFIIEDFDLFLHLVSKNQLGFIPFRVSASRVHSKNTSRRPDIWIKVQHDLIHAAGKRIRQFSIVCGSQLIRTMLRLSWPIWKHQIKCKLSSLRGCLQIRS